MVILASLVALAGAHPIFDPACAGREGSALPAQGLPVTTRDLARLRDIGIAFPYQDSVGLSVSPDGRRVAFQLREADPERNSYCLSIVIAAIDGKSSPVVVDRGGDLIRQSRPQLGLGPYPSGVPEVIRPVWSPDGRYVAFLKRAAQGELVGVWLARADGRGSFPVDQPRGDAFDIRWSEDSQRLSITSRQLHPLTKARDEEALSGYHLDERFIPVSSAKPYFKAPFPVRTDIIRLPAASAAGPSPAVGPKVDSGADWRAMQVADVGQAQNVADLLDPETPKRRCRQAACSGLLVKAWQTKDGRSMSFLRRVGPANDEMALYHWDLRSGKIQRVYHTVGVLLGCEPAAARLICGQEMAAQPRRIVSLDPRTGAIDPVFDPNPDFELLTRGPVKRLYWRNDRGILTFGDLVLPPDHRAGEQHPLIVVTYRSRGFLRGGVGDEYPIFALAARGYAVLSFDNPPDISSFVPTQSPAEAARLNRKDWINRKSILSSIESGVHAVEALGVSDPAKRGITGLSDGSTSLFFALINRRMFHAAIASTCCEEPLSSMALIGDIGADYFEGNGYPLLSQDDTDFWRPMSVSRNAARIDAPLLLNLADDEYLYALEPIRALRFHRKPVDAYLYSDEFHIKWQPAHRLSIYDRNIAWFDFWLRGIAPPNDEWRKRWAGMRDGAGKTNVN